MSQNSPTDSRPSWPRVAAPLSRPRFPSGRGSSPGGERPRLGMRGNFRYELEGGRVTWSAGVARAFGRSPGWAPEGFAGYLALVHPDDRDASQARVEMAIRSCSGFDARERVIWPDGSVVVVRCEAAVETDELGHPVALVGRSRLVEIERDAGRTPTALRRAAADIAHDLRNLLQALRSNVDLCLLESNADDEQRQAIDGIFARLDDLGVELGSLRGRRSSAARWSELRRWLESLRPILADVLGPDRELELQLPPMPLFALVSTPRLETCLLHLVANAREATEEGGRVRVGLAPRAGGERFVISVRDDGEGMSESSVSRALRRGVSTRGPGRGLGLAIVRETVAQMQGRLHIDSEPGRGTFVEMSFDAGEPE